QRRRPRGSARPARRRRPRPRSALSGAQPLRHGLQELPCDRRVALDERPEFPGREAVAAELAVGRDCGAPRAVVDEGDFTEVVTRTELAVLSAADRDRCLASLDHEEPRAGPALVGDRAARVEDALLERAREPLEVAALEVLEERDPLKELHRGFVSHVSILWLCGLGAARKLLDL